MQKTEQYLSTEKLSFMTKFSYCYYYKKVDSQ